MARRIGAELLDALDAKLAAGEISQGEYEAKRIGIQELIRKGQDWDSSVGERLGRTALALLAALAVLAAMSYVAAQAANTSLGVVLMLAGIVMAIIMFAKLKPKG